MMPPDNRPVLQSIAFGNGGIEISYMEPGGDGMIQEIRTLVVSADLLMDELPEVMDTLAEFLDAILLKKRNPPNRIRAGR